VEGAAIATMAVSAPRPVPVTTMTFSPVATYPEATTEVLEFGNFSLILTVLGHDSNLLVRADKDNIYVSHFNSRFSANKEGVNYSWEVLG